MRQTKRGPAVLMALAVLFFLLAGSFAAQGDRAAQPEPSPRQSNNGQGANGNQGNTQERKIPEIVDEPKTIDPATLMPETLAAPATVDFAESSLREVVEWIEKERGIVTLFDNKALLDEGIPLGEPVSDHLANEPVYLLLNRLRAKGLDWYVEDSILHITSRTASAKRMTTDSYNVSDLLDARFDPADLSEAIEIAVAANWISNGDDDAGGMEWLGDVLFVRQTAEVQHQIQGFLTALRTPARQTFTFDPPQHIALRKKFDQNVTVKFEGTPLVRAIEELANQTQADIRLDPAGLREGGVRDREPVTLALTDRKLDTVLSVLLANFKLTWVLRDGVLWITSSESATKELKTAIYDVRDLCQDENESEALSQAITSQTSGPWENRQGSGGQIVFPRTGMMAVLQTETAHRDVLELLATYRAALSTSKSRGRDVHPDDRIETVYYRLDENFAISMESLLPQLVEPESWQTAGKPDAPGKIRRVISPTELVDAQGRSVVRTSIESGTGAAMVVPKSVLIVTQTRGTHKMIADILGRIENGDAESQLGTFGGRGGGFGGGYFRIPSQPSKGRVQE